MLVSKQFRVFRDLPALALVLVLNSFSACSSDVVEEGAESQTETAASSESQPTQIGSAEGEAGPAPVIVATVSTTAVDFLKSYSETCRGVREAKLIARRPGRVSQLPVSLGDPVAQGAAIVKLDDELERLAVAAAEANLALAQSSLDKAALDRERATRMRADSLISESRMELSEIALRRATAEARAAEAELGLARKNLRETAILAPISGEVTALPYEVGETPAAGALVAEVVDRSKLVVDLFIPERDLADVVVGAHAVVSSALYPDRYFEAQLRALSPKADERTKLFHAEILVENPELLLRSGFTVAVALENPANLPQILVPQAALIEREGATYVALAIADQARFQEVVSGKRMGAAVTIASGLEPGAQLIVSGAAGLGDGARINVVEEVPLDSLLN